MTEFQKLHSLANRIDRVEENIKNLISNAIKDESLPKNATMQYYPSLLNNISILPNQKKVYTSSLTSNTGFQVSPDLWTTLLIRLLQTLYNALQLSPLSSLLKPCGFFLRLWQPKFPRYKLTTHIGQWELRTNQFKY
ncbi:hypothetical protein BB559_003552 [Furculomyces boomerangus]|uniref:Uncharacterized protein n=1 Tax=Furculomyces boomerangus TaxID=61424 RepID=A0A2T9YKL8_9FUNG|nr:hypothetical protein BB559_003552 [Furculomyces boomerangus]